ncbi:transposase [Rhodovastum atsumiense]|uniref:IS200/IS605 family element transposase accessory protein TnpB n=1 Tax=Rhodovastum atsumiense TaxID=504468 RepID=A0A5M6IST0_9PROT|nr:RNA-guided endonuclease TnpB family protein [Rhodovastum atsumiense]KAA5611373.1 IS200/IS605 family element transposase accessory protein TnpB [Rhodovastum atsumiense]CAH2603624.1 transposase [Rhodovastum atsumiense]
MKLVAAVKLVPTPEQAACLSETLTRCNAACSWLAALGFATKTFRQYNLHKAAYADLRSRFDLTAQAAVRCIAKVADAFKVNREVAPTFRPDAAQPYDDRIIRFVKAGAAVSIWTVQGRMVIPVVMGEHQRRLMVYRKGEVDLCCVRGKWMLAATCDIPETDDFQADDWLGVDLGIVALATDSDGKIYSGAEVEKVRQHLARRRRGLQTCGTRAAKRRLKKLAGKQRRFQAHTNHCISKALVGDAERTGRGIALEDLKGIRSRVTARGDQRARLGNWAFAQLGGFVVYKAGCAGVPVCFVDPRNTSRACRACGCIDKRNRPTQATFKCVSCGHEAAADHNAALNIRQRVLSVRGDVVRPEVLAA